jgi:predicted GIY-YIG superfamily endonuclease
MTIGKVELGKELSGPELTDEFKMRLGGIDIRPYEKDDVLYILSFEGEGENIGDRDYYKFGISSNISSRLLSHESDKDFPCVYARRVFRCRSRQQAMYVEKYLKRLVNIMKLQLEIGTKKECFHATTEQYDVIESKVLDFLNNDGVGEEDNTEFRLEMYKKDRDVDKEVTLYRIEMETVYKEKERTIQYDLFRNGLINFIELKELLCLIDN